MWLKVVNANGSFIREEASSIIGTNFLEDYIFSLLYDIKLYTLGDEKTDWVVGRGGPCKLGD